VREVKYGGPPIRVPVVFERKPPRGLADSARQLVATREKRFNSQVEEKKHLPGGRKGGGLEEDDGKSIPAVRWGKIAKRKRTTGI